MQRLNTVLIYTLLKCYHAVVILVCGIYGEVAEN